MIRVYDMATGELLRVETEGDVWKRHAHSDDREDLRRSQLERVRLPGRDGLPALRLALAGETPTER